MLSHSSLSSPRWYMIPARALLVAFLLTLVVFAVTLLISLLGTVVIARAHETIPDLRFAYRDIALPVAVVAGTIALVSSLVVEIHHYRRCKALAGIAPPSR